MNKQVALFACVLFISWLFVRDRKLRPMTSGALWIPLLWIMIIGTKSVSVWLGLESITESPDSYLEGSPLDRMVFIVLIIMGTAALLHRRINLMKILDSNRWLFAFLLYCGASAIWSDYPFVSLKRWIKDLGNIIMVLIILTETDPVRAIKAVFARYSYVAIALSVLMIHFFPELGISYDRITQEPEYIAVTTHKNELGIVLTICGLFLVWDLFEMRTKTDKAGLVVSAALMGMLIWLLRLAGSMTAVVCLTLGTGVLLLTNLPVVRRQVRHLGVYSLAAVSLIFSLYYFSAVTESFATLLGRDVTFTGRTEIWEDLLKEHVNPLIGTGYMSYWLGSTVGEQYNNIEQAHNGYLETYLNGGLVGLFLLIAMILFTGSKLKRELLHGSSVGKLLFCFLCVTVFYNLTEAMFNKLSLIWFVLLIAALSCPRPAAPVPEKTAKRAQPCTRAPGRENISPAWSRIKG